MRVICTKPTVMLFDAVVHFACCSARAPQAELDRRDATTLKLLRSAMHAACSGQQKGLSVRESK